MILDEFEAGDIQWDDLSKEARQAWRLREKWLSENAPGSGCQDEVTTDKPSNARRKRNRKKKT